MTNLKSQPVLVTGGAGYIGSHTVLELLNSGYRVVVLDNLANASPEALRRVERITGRPAPLVRGDIRDEALLQDHPTIIYFLTMLVGAGGNAGNQASVRVIRGM